MKINALVKGMHPNGWIHEEGLIVMDKVLDIPDSNESLFLAYNVDSGEYDTIKTNEFIAIDEEIVDMIAILDNESLPDNLANLTIEIQVKDIDDDFYMEAYEDELDLDEEYYLDEDDSLSDSNLGLEIEYGDDGESIEVDLEDLVNLINTGWDDSKLSNLLLDLIESEDDEWYYEEF